uniref:Uncharacterized protein n=1 Tax=Anopheles darlingi TaxID=43151 RepID=A0A2M4D3N7_ANODA
MESTSSVPLLSSSCLVAALPATTGSCSGGLTGDCSWCTTAQVVMMVWHESSLMLVLELMVEMLETFASWNGLMPLGGSPLLMAAAAASVAYSSWRRFTPFRGSFCTCSIAG